MKEILCNYDSYEPIKTKIDSAFISIYNDSTIRKKVKLYIATKKICDVTIKECKSCMRVASIWKDSRSSYGRQKYKEAENNLEKTM